MIIKLEDINPSSVPEYFISDRQRLACATSVRLLDSSRLLVGNLAGQRLYLVRYDLAAGTHQIVSSVGTQFAGRPVNTDLVDFDGREAIVTSNCETASVSLYRLASDQMSFVKDFPIPHPQAGFCHGVKFLPPGDVICATCTTTLPQVFFICAKSGALLHHFGDGVLKPKDICFLGGNRMLVLYSFGHATPSKGTAYSAKVSLVEFDLITKTHAVLDEIITEETHVDCVTHVDGRVFVNNQMRDVLLEFRLAGDRLSFVRELNGYHFPHGVDVLPSADLLAVTNYGNNTLVLEKLLPPVPKYYSVLAIVTHHRYERWLAQCLESLMAQTRPPDNIVVLDDGSKPPPLDIIKKFPQVTLLAVAENVGMYRLLQQIVDNTNYDAYLFQDADDWSTPDRLAALLAEATRTNSELVGCQIESVFENITAEPDSILPRDCRAAVLANPIAHPLLLPTSLVSRALIQRLGGFATGLRYGADSEFIRRAIFATHAVNVPLRCYFRRVHPAAATRDPYTGYGSTARTEIQALVRARAAANVEKFQSGNIPDLAPLTVAGSVKLQHLIGPPLLTAPAPEVALIAGMHRSGTSMVAHLLHLCGLQLGPREELGLTDKSNRDGHWENARFLVINEAILNELGGAWDLPPSPPSDWLESEPIQKLVSNARDAVAGFGDGRTWGWKDPRNSLTLPFWKSLIPGLKVVVCLRNPLEVALSLRARGVSSYAFGLTLWKHYYRELLAHTRPAERIVTHYEAYFTDPIQEVRRVLAFLGLPASENALSQCRSTVKGDMRNHRIATPDLAELRVEPEILQLYQELCAEAGWAPTAASLPVQAQKDYKAELSVCLQKKTEASARPGAPLDHLLMDQVLAQREIGALRGQRDCVREKNQALEQRLAEQIRTASARQDQLTHLQNEAQREIGDLRGEVDRNREKIHALEQRLAEQVRTASARQDQQEQRTQEMRRGLEAQLAHRDQVISDERDQKSRLQIELKQHAEQAAQRDRYTALLLKISRTLRDRLPASARVLVVSKGDEGLLAATGCEARHFPADAGGAYRGYHPADSAEAVALLTQARQAGGEFFVLPETAFWWLKYYPDFRRHLETQCPAVAIEETCKIYDLRPIA